MPPLVAPPLRAICGRVVRIESQKEFEAPSLELTLRTKDGIRRVQTKDSSTLKVNVGDIVEWAESTVRVLTPNRLGQTRFAEMIQDPRRVRATAVRHQVETGIRDFFSRREFFETRTPLLVPCAGMEPHIRPFEVHSAGQKQARAYLPTSPEFAMKRLLVGGLERIFQICPAFRDEPNSVTHEPEFTLLEWYRAYAGYEEIMQDVEELFESLALRVHGQKSLRYQGREISVATPWPRLRVRDLFLEFTGLDLSRSTTDDLARRCRELGLKCDPALENWDDLYFKIWLNIIEPKLPNDRAVFVTRYPASQAALSVVDRDPDGSEWAKRFEAYAGGLELGNAFEELTDPDEQRRRFIKDMELRTQVYGPEFPASPLDENFLHALEEGMPPAGGIAMGVDRLVMLLADETEIRYTFWLTSSDCF